MYARPRNRKTVVFDIFRAFMQLVEAFGLVVRAARERQKLTQSQLAERADLHWTAVSHIERGTRPAHLATLESISTGLGISLSKLIRRAEELQVEESHEK
jgi:transcriptional regulator with XRE-family HTH domain